METPRELDSRFNARRFLKMRKFAFTKYCVRCVIWNGKFVAVRWLSGTMAKVWKENIKIQGGNNKYPHKGREEESAECGREGQERGGER